MLYLAEMLGAFGEMIFRNLQLVSRKTYRDQSFGVRQRRTSTRNARTDEIAVNTLGERRTKPGSVHLPIPGTALIFPFHRKRSRVL